MMQERLDTRSRGFTLVELLLVIAVTTVVAGIVLAFVSNAGARGRRSVCLDNLKQLATACQMYSADNADRFASNVPQDPHVPGDELWVAGNVALPLEATNRALIRQGLLFPYLNSERILHCPADFSHVGGYPRVRSYSMNGWFGSRYMEQAMAQSDYRTFVKNTELAPLRPHTLWIFADEHESTIDDGFFLVTMNDSRPFANFPAARHDRAFALAFGDGHVETCPLKDPETRQSLQSPGRVSPDNLDWNRLKQITTVPWNR